MNPGTTTNFAPTYGQPPAATTQTYYEQVPQGTISPSGGFGTSGGSGTRNFTPAETSPSLLEGINPQGSSPFSGGLGPAGSTSRNFHTSAQRNTPATINIQAKTARSPIRERWSYSPVRTASYSKASSTTTTSRSVPQRQTQSRQSWSSSGIRSNNTRQPAKKSGWVEIK